MKLANVLEGGLSGSGSVNLLQDLFQELNSRSKRPLGKSGIMKKINKYSGSTSDKAKKFYVKLARKLLTNTANYGISGVGKKKNALLKGGLLGAAAGIVAAFKKPGNPGVEHQSHNGVSVPQKEDHKNLKGNKILTISLYALGGLATAAILKKISETKKGKGMSKWLNKKSKKFYSRLKS